MVRKSKSLEERHQKIINFIAEYQRIHKHPPSLLEIGKGCNISSTSVVNYYLDQMEKEGVIERDRKISREANISPQDSWSLGEIIRINFNLAYTALAGDATTNAPLPASTINKKKRKGK